MGATLDDEYLTWLYGQVAAVKLKNPTRTYWSLLRQLYSMEFVWLIPNDDNRVEDGRNLRYEFMNEVHGVRRNRVDPEWMSLECSMLEMLIALARRAAFETSGDAKDWFWHLTETLDIRVHNDSVYNQTASNRVEHILHRVIWRQYEPDGQGGLFPLRNPFEDQRRVEIWYQLSAYVVELM